jgi:hypothetical protein
MRRNFIENIFKTGMVYSSGYPKFQRCSAHIMNEYVSREEMRTENTVVPSVVTVFKNPCCYNVMQSFCNNMMKNTTDRYTGMDVFVACDKV